MVNFFSIDCERSTVYIYFGVGVLFCTSSKGFVFVVFFFFCYHETTGYSTLDFFLSSYLTFFFLFFPRLLKGIFPPFFHPPLFYRNPQFPPVSYRFFVVFLGFTYSFIFIYLFNFYHLFFFSYFFQFVVVYFLYPSILFLGLQDVGKEQQGTNPEVMCQLLDSSVRPILSHACEVWTGRIGAKGLQQVEQVHRMFLRGILGVNKTTSTFVVSGEFGRFSSEHFWWQQTLKYYDRVGESTPDRLSYCAYQTQVQMLSVPNDNQQCRFHSNDILHFAL